MPKESRAGRSSVPSGTTPFPDVLLDRIMPRLYDTEWRLLCVIVRQTFGWMTDGQPKERDWLSHFQLRKRTGRSSASISVALEFLARNRLIEISDAAGAPLSRAAERRRHRSHLYFRLHPRLIAEPHPRIRRSARNQHLERTRNTLNKRVLVVARRTNPPNGNESPNQETGSQISPQARSKPKRRP